MNRMRLAIIDGGAAGHKIADDLRNAVDVTLIDPKTYRDAPMALRRLLVEPSALPARMDDVCFLPEVRLVLGKALALSDGAVRVETREGRQDVAFNDTVIATGCRHPAAPITPEAMSPNQPG